MASYVNKAGRAVEPTLFTVIGVRPSTLRHQLQLRRYSVPATAHQQSELSQIVFWRLMQQIFGTIPSRDVYFARALFHP